MKFNPVLGLAQKKLNKMNTLNTIKKFRWHVNWNSNYEKQANKMELSPLNYRSSKKALWKESKCQTVVKHMTILEFVAVFSMVGVGCTPPVFLKVNDFFFKSKITNALLANKFGSYRYRLFLYCFDQVSSRHLKKLLLRVEESDFFFIDCCHCYS